MWIPPDVKKADLGRVNKILIPFIHLIVRIQFSHLQLYHTSELSLEIKESLATSIMSSNIL